MLKITSSYFRSKLYHKSSQLSNFCKEKNIDPVTVNKSKEKFNIKRICKTLKKMYKNGKNPIKIGDLSYQRGNSKRTKSVCDKKGRNSPAPAIQYNIDNIRRMSDAQTEMKRNKKKLS
jgi:hypothetical protein